jgi:hypothetical protein
MPAAPTIKSIVRKIHIPPKKSRVLKDNTVGEFIAFTLIFNLIDTSSEFFAAICLNFIWAGLVQANFDSVFSITLYFQKGAVNHEIVE